MAQVVARGMRRELKAIQMEITAHAAANRSETEQRVSQVIGMHRCRRSSQARISKLPTQAQAAAVEVQSAEKIQWVL